jgi:hypothetical protein
MDTNKLQPKFFLVAAIILVFAAFRVFFPGFNSNIANYTPLGAIAIFGGAMFKNRMQSIFIPVAIMFISDLVINKMYYDFGFFYSGWVWTYVAFALMAIASRLIMKKVTLLSTVVSAVVATLIHWIVTDTAVWAIGCGNVKPFYSADFAGLVKCHIAAIPYEKNVLIGTLAYSAIMFGVFYFVQKKNPTLAYVKAA